MNHPRPATVNVADRSANVGVQADTVHGGVHFHADPSDTPERKFEVGLNYLRSGVPSEARRLISRAVMDGHRTGKSYFYLMLALLSGRTLQHLSPEDLNLLRTARGWITDQPRDGWTDAILLINRLLEARPPSDTSDPSDLDVIIKEFDGLHRRQREEVLRNLEVFLDGPHQDWTWKRAFDVARRERWERDRQDRVWRFFQPQPAGPRVQWPAAVRTKPKDWIRTVAATALFAAAGLFLVAASWRHSWPAAIGEVLMISGAGCLGARSGLRRRHLLLRLRDKERQFSPSNVREPTPGRHRFASGVDRQFRDYFGRYVPAGVDRAEWLVRTAGVRQALRDEVVVIYREDSVAAKRVAWLTRFLVSDVKRQWQAGTLWSYRDELRVPVTVRALLTFSVAALIVAVPSLVWGALQTGPLAATAATMLAVLGGVPAVRGWAGIVLERRRFAAEEAEAQQAYEKRKAAFGRWRRKLATKPDDGEMAHWLDCDHKALIEEAMRHYKLAPHDVIAHAYIEAPPDGRYKRARVKNGPSRYSRYKLLVFLLTVDGVRQMAVGLNFETGEFLHRERSNYRYDAVAAVHVVEADDGEKVFELTLVNNHSVKVAVTGPPPQTLEPGEDSRTISRVTLDAAGLDNTLHVLEGIAAEGKQWITYERRREQEGRQRLVDAVDGSAG